MKACNHTIVSGFLLALVVLTVPGWSHAAINGFQFNGIEGVGTGCALDARIGKSIGATEHVINIEDCADYASCSVKIMWSLANQPAADAVYVVKVSNPGGTCSDTDLTTLGDSCMPTLAVEEAEISTHTNMSFSIPYEYLTGGNCGAGTERATKVYIIVKELGQVAAETIAFTVDLDAPAAPELGETTEGDSSLTVTWTDPANEGETDLKYHVYWAKESFSNDNKAAIAKRESAVTGRSYQVKGLDNDTEYWFGVTAVDENDNEGPLSAVSSAMPIEVLDFFEAYKAGPEVGREDGGFCFIATAAFGSYLAPDVWMLRRFRDEALMTTAPGRAFVRFYYAVSPPLAERIAASESARAVVRAGLTPVIAVARAALAAPAGWAGRVLVGLAGLWVLAVAVTAVVVVRGSRRRS
jgi:hypothetical protein